MYAIHSYIMDFTPELIAFQGVITAANSKYSFSQLNSRGGNEETIHNVVKFFEQFLLQKQYYKNEDIAGKYQSEIKKLCFYVVLNSDFAALDKIVDLPNLSHLVWTTSTIPVCLFCEIVWMLHWERYIGEVIAYGDPKLSVNILKALLNGVRYCSAQDSIEKLRAIAEASYICLIRLSFFNYDNALTSSLLTDLYTYFLRSITHFVSPPNNGKLEESSEEVRYVHLGKAFRSLLQTSITCLSVYESPQQFDSDYFGLYLSMVSSEDVKTKCLPKSVRDNSDAAVLEYIEKCNVAALDKCVEIVINVSVAVFCHWSEHTEDGRSLQRSIGELCHHLHKKLEGINNLSQHTLVSMLPQLSCKPADLFDVIREADDEALIINAQTNSTEREHWLNAIIKRPNLYEHEILMSCLLNHIGFLKSEVCENLFKKSLEYLQKNKYQNERVRSLTLQCFVGLDAERKLDLMCHIFPNRVFHNYLESLTFHNKMNETFNKLISTTDSDLSEIYDIFIQNPAAVYQKILNIGVENPKQASLMVRVLAMLKSMSEYYCDGEKEPALLRAVDELCAVVLETEVQENSFVCLLSGLIREMTALKKTILLRTLMPCVHKSAVRKEFTALKLHLKVLQNAYNVEVLVQYRAPLLAMLAQVLSVVRWDFSTYTTEAPATLQEAIDLQVTLFSSYNGVVPDKDANWLKAKLKNLKAQNMYYFKDIWRPSGENYIQVITNMETLELEQYPVLLAMVLHSCTHKEWSQVWHSLMEQIDPKTALEFMYQAMVIMTTTEIKHRTVNSYACLRFCYRNFVSIVKEHFLINKSESLQVKVKLVLENFVVLANVISEEDIGEIGGILLPLLASTIGEKTLPDISYTEIVNKLNNGSFAKLVENVLSNMSM